MRQLLVLLMTGFVVAASFAASLSPLARAEIESLLGRLEASRCEFQRNGAWHSAADAKAHLRVKLNYLEERGMVASAEQFIERAATQSSMTGGPYLVRCANAASVPSSTWLSSQLQLMRSASAGKNAP
ncbi:MAG: DUF5329 domain-containing protein [Burkholderiaceae bacterium]|jgi:hypothetical protein